jgi:hypothetical protein
MRVIDFIRGHIARLDFDKILLTGDLLEYGSRASVDVALSRLVGAKVLLRVANGVFVRAGSKIPTAEEIAKAKAERFGKTMGAYKGNLSGEVHLGGDREPYLYATDGRTSSFGTIHGRVTLVHVCWRTNHVTAIKGGECCESIVVYETLDSVAQRWALGL